MAASSDLTHMAEEVAQELDRLSASSSRMAYAYERELVIGSETFAARAYAYRHAAQIVRERLAGPQEPLCGRPGVSRAPRAAAGESDGAIS